MTETLAPDELRNIRRYAFCLLGNLQLSDISVESALNSFVSVSGHVKSHLDFYRRVNQTSAATLANVGTIAGGGLFARLYRLPREQRQVVALRAIIGLPFVDIASIMEMSEKTVRLSYLRALLLLRDKPATVLIIEDEAFIALDLQQIVRDLGLSVAGIAKNRAEALRIAGITRPNLILADYRLIDDTGVEVVKAIRERMPTNVIYITSHIDEVAATRDCEEDLVIAKPFNQHSLAAAVQTRLAA